MRSSSSRFEPIILAGAAVLGLTFWFIVGFPFANHNESYVLSAQLKVMSLAEVVSHPLFPVANYRPLGQAVAWLAFRYSGGSLIPVQLFNYVVAAIAWLIVMFALRERRTFSVVALGVGGFYFAGYIYLFHLQGVFYSPLLLFVSVTFLYFDRALKPFMHVLIFLGMAVTSLFHPYAVLVYIAATLGYLLERWRDMKGKDRLILIVLVALSFGLIEMLVLAPGRQSLLKPQEMVTGFLTSYRMIELDAPVAALSLVLSCMTVLSYPVHPDRRIPLLLATIVSCVVLYLAGVPVIIFWIFLSGVKMMMLRKWWLAFLIGATALFPAPAATGSPTYAVFVLMSCSAALAYGWQQAEVHLSFLGRRAGVAWICVILVVSGLVRSDIRVPLISHLALPLIAEREKTEQLERIILWVHDSPYRNYNLVLEQNSLNPSVAEDAINRTHRPPTDQEYLDVYLKSLREPEVAGDSSGKQLYIAFGQKATKGGDIIHVEHEKSAGDATVSLVRG